MSVHDVCANARTGLECTVPYVCAYQRGCGVQETKACSTRQEVWREEDGVCLRFVDGLQEMRAILRGWMINRTHTVVEYLYGYVGDVCM